MIKIKSEIFCLISPGPIWLTFTFRYI